MRAPRRTRDIYFDAGEVGGQLIELPLRASAPSSASGGGAFGCIRV